MPRQQGNDLPMLFRRFGAQFPHVAQQRKPALSLHRGEIVERRLHRRRIGVVGINYQGIAPRAHHLRTYVVRSELRYGFGGILARHPEIVPYGDGRQHVVGVVCAHQLRADHGAVQPDAQERLLRRAFKNLRMLVVAPVSEEMAGNSRRHALELGVVLIDEYHRAATAAEPFVELPLCGLHPFERAEAQQMGAADVGDQPVVRTAHPHQFRNVVRVVRSHLYHGDFRIGTHGQQRQRHAYVVVQIAFGGADAVLFREHGPDQVLGRRLAVGSGEADYRKTSSVQPGAVHDSKLLKCGEGVIHKNQPAVFRKALPVGHGPCGTLGQRGEGIVVAVEILAPQREEYLSAGDFAAVGSHPASAVQVYRIKFFYCHCC